MLQATCRSSQQTSCHHGDNWLHQQKLDCSTERVREQFSIQAPD